MFKGKKNILEYWTSVAGLTEIEDSCPSRYLDVMPTWWKNVKTQKDFNNIKDCPSFVETFKSAYVLRMWCDLEVTVKDNNIFWRLSDSQFDAQVHQYEQFMGFLPEKIRKDYSFVLKPVSPWNAKTPKGYSIYQMPVTYDFNKDFSAMPGIIHTDVYHHIHPQLLITSENKTFKISRGTPLALHFPFKREKFSLLKREKTNKDDFLLGRSRLISVSKFKNSYRDYTKNFM